MKNAILLLVFILALTLAGCSVQVTEDAQAAAAEIIETAQATSEPATAAPSKDVVDIREKLFIAQINEIYTNADDYMDKTIRYEGVFDSYTYTDAGDMFYSVIRYGPGCCGNDGNVGSEVIWDKAYPKQGEWISVEGVLERYEEFGETYLRLRVSKLDVQNKRGNDTVSQ